ncbi:hypothetical protein [Cupriavidus plantarum]|uniref:hypothetical protein n=1 Tax=Cupriavidus plantarum TaxID=942865 RepID=UPI00339D6F77
MAQGKILRDLVVLDRYIAEKEAELRRCESGALATAAATAMDGGDDRMAERRAIQRSLDVLRIRRQELFSRDLFARDRS